MKTYTTKIRVLMVAALAIGPMFLVGCHVGKSSSSSSVPAAPNDISKVQNVVVIYLENRSFDNLFGNFPGANGINNYTTANAQVDFDGKTILAKLPPVWGSETDPNLGLVSTLTNAPFRLDAAPVGLPQSAAGPDLVHRFYQNQMQINGGANNMFAAYSNRGGLVMGTYDGSGLNLFKLAQQYTLADNFFMGAFGGSFLNHQYFVCACAPYNPAAPVGMRAVVTTPGGSNLVINSAKTPSSIQNGQARFVQDGQYTDDGYAVNTILPPYQPSATAAAPGANPMLANPADPNNPVLPPIDSSKTITIGDTLSNGGISWKWYAGAWNNALKEGTSPNIGTTANPYKIIWAEKPGQEDFEPHHQPFNYYSRFDPTTTSGQNERAAHLKDAIDLYADAAAGTLPAVSFYKPAGNINAHPGYSDIQSSDAEVAKIVGALQKSPQWGHMAVIITTDENGGFFDHVAPPKGDRFGPGTRIPAVVISPYAKKGFVDHTYYDTVSILKFITKRFNLKPLAGFRQATGDLTNAFDFTQN